TPPHLPGRPEHRQSPRSARPGAAAGLARSPSRQPESGPSPRCPPRPRSPSRCRLSCRFLLALSFCLPRLPCLLRALGPAAGAALLVARQLVLARPVAIAQPLHRSAAHHMLADDLLHVLQLHPPVPDVLRVDHEERAIATLVEAAAVVDPHAPLQGRLVLHQLLELGVDAQPVAVNRRAPVAAGADEDVALEDMPRDLR